MKNYYFIYRVTNKITNQYYIGMHSTDNLNDGYLGSGIRIRRSINKYGKENHLIEILEYCDSLEEMKLAEERIACDEEILNDNCLNLKCGGIGGSTMQGKIHSEETKEKIRQSLLGKKHSEETKLKISLSNKGKHFGKLTEEHRKKISISNKGKNNKLKGIPRSEETKAKISISHKNKPYRSRKPLSEETKRKISESHKGRKYSNEQK